MNTLLHHEYRFAFSVMSAMP